MSNSFSFNKLTKLILFIVINLSVISTVFAAKRTVDLNVAYKMVTFADQSVRAIAVNNQIPGPTLHFKEGDQVTINVYNHLDKGTSIHWHGLLVPWQMDGVEMLSQPPIPPGGVFHYRFTLHQAGTYWYHAHADLQEQRGLYGAIIIDPLHQPPYHYNKDFVMVLSDWSNTKPEQIYANLKKDGDFYSDDFPLQPSLQQFIKSYSHATPAERKQIWHTYLMTEKMRMSPYDISDVAYDAFLLNGQPNSNPWRGQVKIGDIVRLRFINAGASTYFNIKIPNTTLQIVQVQGNAIKPYYVNSLNMAPAETYDVLVKITRNNPYIIYAESADTSGAAYGALVTTSQQTVNVDQVQPFPEPKPEMTMSMASSSMPAMKMSGMNMTQPTMSHQGPPKYQNLVSPFKTNDPNKPVHIIEMELGGYMDKYLWFINGVPAYKAKPIMIVHGQRYRIIFINPTMMHHPMHLHGHWFILRNGHGTYDPLMHTIDLPPGGTATVDFDADTNGQWFFHCHNLYHMVAGMARVFRYNSLDDKDTPMHTTIIHPAAWYLSNNLELQHDFAKDIYEMSLKSLYGSDFNKMELNMVDAEMQKGSVENADIDLFYWHLISQFWAVKGGINYVYRPAVTPFIQPGVGIEGLMPYFIDTDARVYYHSGSLKLDLQLGRDTQLTHHLFLNTSLRGILSNKTVSQDEIGSGLNSLEYIIRPYYELTNNISLYTEFNHTNYFGPLKDRHLEAGDGSFDNTLSLGIDLLF